MEEDIDMENKQIMTRLNHKQSGFMFSESMLSLISNVIFLLIANQIQQIQILNESEVSLNQYRENYHEISAYTIDGRIHPNIKIDVDKGRMVDTRNGQNLQFEIQSVEQKR